MVFDLLPFVISSEKERYYCVRIYTIHACIVYYIDVYVLSIFDLFGVSSVKQCRLVNISFHCHLFHIYISRTQSIFDVEQFDLNSAITSSASCFFLTFICMCYTSIVYMTIHRHKGKMKNEKKGKEKRFGRMCHINNVC